MSFISNFIRAASLHDRFVHKLQVIEQNHPTADKQGKSECCNSGVCCWRRPGTINQEDLQKLALFLNLTPQEVFKEHLVVDRINGVLTLIPRRKHQEAGKMIPMEETYSIETPCVFLTEENKCAIHEAKPIRCREFKCWEDTERRTTAKWTEQELYKLGWNGFDPDDYDYSDYCDMD